MEYAVIIWPAAFDNASVAEIENIMSKYGKIVSSTERKFSYIGLRNLMIQLYKEEEWAGSYWNNFRYIKYKLNPCYRKNANTLLYMFECESLESVLEMKDEVRLLCKIEKASIHTADTREETEMVEQIFSSEGTCKKMNGQLFYSYHIYFSECMKRIKK